MGRFTDIVALKTNDSYCYFLLWQGRKKGGQGQSQWTIFEIMPFPSWGDALFDMERALQKRHFSSFAEKG